MESPHPKWSTSQVLPQFLQSGQSLEAYLSSLSDEVPDLVLTGIYPREGQFPHSWESPPGTHLDGGVEVIKRDEPGRRLAQNLVHTKNQTPGHILSL